MATCRRVNWLRKSCVEVIEKNESGLWVCQGQDKVMENANGETDFNTMPSNTLMHLDIFFIEVGK